MSASDETTPPPPPPPPGHRGDDGMGFSFPPPTKPRRVAGGIRVAARGDRPGATWWARRWFASLDALGLGERLERGRAYARGGQVLELQLAPGAVTATVQGTRRTPYTTRIELAAFTQLEWLDVARELASRGTYRASLLANTMPDDIEAVCARHGLQLFPQLDDDLQITCTCDDWATPCRHAAAVCFVLGERLDRDPFALFQLRGIERELLLTLLDGIDTAAPSSTDMPAVDAGEQDAPARDATPGDAVADAAAAGPDLAPAPVPSGFVDLAPPVLDAPLVRLLGPLAQWRGSEDFTAAMTRLYARVSGDPRALDAAQR